MINRQQAMQINTLADCASTIAEAQSNGAEISVTLKVNSEIIDAFDSLGVSYSVNEVVASEPISE